MQVSDAAHGGANLCSQAGSLLVLHAEGDRLLLVVLIAHVESPKLLLLSIRIIRIYQRCDI